MATLWTTIRGRAALAYTAGYKKRAIPEKHATGLNSLINYLWS
jgi:hypothetical protein